MPKSNLRVVFYELLKSEVFKAKNLATKKEGLCSVSFYSTTGEIDEAVKRASPNNGDYDNIIVRDGERLVGFIRREQLENKNDILSLLRSRTIKFDRYTFSAEDGLKEVVERIYTDFKRTGYGSAYLIKNKTEDLGVITYADLNRKSVYIYNYIIILFLEQWIKNIISQKYRTKSKKINDNWMRSLRTKQSAKLIDLSREKGESTLGVAGIDDLVMVFKHEPSLQNIRSQYKDSIPNETLSDIISVRPKVMHPTKLLVPKNNIKNGLKRLMRILRLVDDFIQYEDSNEKNRGWPTVR